MDTNQLEAFDQIVRQGGFSRAARALNIAQPTISLRLQALEQAVGGALFLRGGSRLELTELGRSFLPYARQALSSLQSGIEAAQLTQSGERGRITIATLPSLASAFFATSIERLHQHYPLVNIYVHTGHNREVVGMLQDGFARVGLLTWPVFTSELKVLLHLREPLVFVARADHPLARQVSIPASELEELAHPFFHVDWSIESMLWQRHLGREHGSEIELPPQTAYDLVARGRGAALLVRTMVAADLAAGRLVEIEVQDSPTFYRESALLVPARQQPAAAFISEFIRIFREEAREFCQST